MFDEFHKVKAHLTVTASPFAKGLPVLLYYTVLIMTTQFYFNFSNCSKRFVNTPEVGSTSLGKLSTVWPSRAITYL
jgi:hypothetical protein